MENDCNQNQFDKKLTLGCFFQEFKFRNVKEIDDIINDDISNNPNNYNLKLPQRKELKIMHIIKLVFDITKQCIRNFYDIEILREYQNISQEILKEPNLKTLPDYVVDEQVKLLYTMGGCIALAFLVNEFVPESEIVKVAHMTLDGVSKPITGSHYLIKFNDKYYDINGVLNKNQFEEKQENNISVFMPVEEKLPEDCILQITDSISQKIKKANPQLKNLKEREHCQ